MCSASRKGILMKVAIVNIGRIVTGSFRTPFADGDQILLNGGLIEAVGSVPDTALADCDVVIDADGATAVPGFIDSQVHVTFGDYTPRQKTVGFLESYVHGGVTTSISASEVHVPGRPKDPEGVKALALAAHKCFEYFRPGGMRVHGGSVILEPGLTKADFQELKDKGVWLAKAGFGGVATPFDYAPMLHWAREVGMITNVHTGGASIPGSAAVTSEHLLAMNPHVSFHVNGGPIALRDDEYPMLVRETDIALQVCTAGNHRTMKLCAELAAKHDQFHRFLIATDTPTGSGIMPLGIMYAIAFLASMTNIPPEWLIAAATGNNADVYRLNCGYLAPGRDADVVLLDACLGFARDDALSAFANGDIAAVSAVFTDGVPRFVGKSRNTPAGKKTVKVIKNEVRQNFGGPAH
jgi:enamidase